MEMDTDMDRGMERFRRLSVAADIVGQLFLDEPSPEMLTALTNPDLLKDWPLQDPDSREATAMLERSAAQPDTVEQLQRDHLYLFIGTGAPLAQPYESPYFSLDGLVLDGVAPQVEAFYATVGFQPALSTGGLGNKLGNLPPDHIGFELRCIAHVAALVAGAPNAREYERLVALLRQFAINHPARFAEQVLAGVTEHARTAVYQALPGLTQGVRRAAVA